MGRPYGRCVSVTIDQHDITFGCAKKVEEGYAELMETEKPEAVFIVTTCVPEIIGDDFDALSGAYRALWRSHHGGAYGAL
ncbi:MAG: hypothetical protein IIZ39_12455 [Blautia sp.]|nr:hypothetical protein [Blautia sp.]